MLNVRLNLPCNRRLTWSQKSADSTNQRVSTAYAWCSLWLLTTARDQELIQSGKMATLLNSLFFVFKISLLPNYHFTYYDYVLKWCNGVTCNWCVSLDIGLILALTYSRYELKSASLDPSNQIKYFYLKSVFQTKNVSPRLILLT